MYIIQNFLVSHIFFKLHVLYFSAYAYELDLFIFSFILINLAIKCTVAQIHLRDAGV